MKADLAIVKEWDFTRVIVAHGVGLPALTSALGIHILMQDVIETDAKKAWDAGYAKYAV